METAIKPNPNEPTVWTVCIDDNFHYMDESYRVVHSTHATFEEAVRTAISLTEDSVSHCGHGNYRTFGEDPFIKPAPDPDTLATVLGSHTEWPAEIFADGYFSAWSYATYLARTH